MRPTSVISSVCLFAAATSAWQGFEPEVQDPAHLVPRQDDSTTAFDLSYSGVQGDTATTVSTKASSDDASETGTGSATRTGSQTGGTTGKATTGGTNKASSTARQTTKTFDARLPAGGVQLITPLPQATSYYKIMDKATFAWNYTSLSITPSAVDVYAYCSSNSYTYTIATNATIPQGPQTVIWDTGDYQSSAATQLLTGTYTLIIHDAGKDVSAAPMAGYLAAFNQYTFGMYVPAKPTPLDEFVCAACSGAMSSMERKTIGFMVGMAGLTVLSFGWFAGVAGLL
ncbi:[4Fe-4S] proteins maturation [Elasticomyces elasticus]|nr:[4Fe-4S] proteins maturation [Elasticomyces elasticus]KAK3668473.1 [4Fe-4S] proteins maturation [Elasticomyces elasticus]KAK4930838.1 [4Fe-4S] proteins maturation [Elasticomyces elasticus]KAK5753711.1 [4Fe-4S] proteins maturation [Elasticomyces elasticus]